MTRRLLVIAAHPDDEVLGCGGLLSRTRREGGEAAVLVLTDGCSCQYPGRPELVGERQDEARQAMEELGGIDIEFVGFPDMGLVNLPPAEVNAPVAAAVTRLEPDWVLVHHGGDLNRDHTVAHEAARVACRPGAGPCPRLLSYETLSSTEWGGMAFQPDLFVALEQVDLERKIAALSAYATEVRPFPHPRSTRAVEHLAGLRGAQAGVVRAEAFHTVWQRV